MTKSGDTNGMFQKGVGDLGPHCLSLLFLLAALSPQAFVLE